MTGIGRVAAKFGAFAVASGLLLLLLVNTMVNGLGGDANTYDAEFADVSGLRIGDDVKVAGVRVGRVESIEVDGDAARVSFELTDEQPILDNTTIVMRYQNLLGQRYLALVQGEDRGKELDDGAKIPLDRTNPGFDLTELLNGFRPLFEVLQPDDVNQLATSMVKVLQGEGGTVETLLQQTVRADQLHRRPRRPHRRRAHQPHAGAGQPRRAGHRAEEHRAGAPGADDRAWPGTASPSASRSTV